MRNAGGCLLSLGLGAITRHTAGGISVFVGIFFVIPPLMNILPTSWNDAISEYPCIDERLEVSLK